MIERIYMGIDGRRDHSFRVPRPDLSVELGTPNACNDCHQDQTAQWATKELEGRFSNRRHRGPHAAAVLAPAWEGTANAEALQGLLVMAADPTAAGIVRASALNALVPYASPDLAGATAMLLTDPDPLVRSAALALQFPAGPAERLQRLLPLLKDPRKSVRIDAARALLDLLPEGVGPEQAETAQSALAEFDASLGAKADFPETQMTLAGTMLTRRQFQEAEEAFHEAVKLDPQLVQAWVMIARLRLAREDAQGAKVALREGLMANPDSSGLKSLLAGLKLSSGE